MIETTTSTTSPFWVGKILTTGQLPHGWLDGTGKRGAFPFFAKLNIHTSWCTIPKRDFSFPPVRDRTQFSHANFPLFFCFNFFFSTFAHNTLYVVTQDFSVTTTAQKSTSFISFYLKALAFLTFECALFLPSSRTTRRHRFWTTGQQALQQQQPPQTRTLRHHTYTTHINKHAHTHTIKRPFFFDLTRTQGTQDKPRDVCFPFRFWASLCPFGASSRRTLSSRVG